MPTPNESKRNLNIAHIAPFVAYLLGTAFIARFGDEWYPVLYSGLVVGFCVWLPWLYAGQQIFKPHWRVLPAVLVGLLGIALWISISQLHIETQLAAYLPNGLQPDPRVSYNPFEHLTGWAVWGFIAARVLGITVVVALVEELFWRSFLLRWLIDPDWEKVPLGEYTLASCWIVTLMFAMAHPEWLAAAVYCLLLNLLLYRKKDLWLCIVAHGTSNLALAIYVLNTEHWWLW